MDWPDEKIVDVFISRLRRKLRQAGGTGECIRTDWRRGFRIEAGDAPRQASAMPAKPVLAGLAA